VEIVGGSIVIFGTDKAISTEAQYPLASTDHLCGPNHPFAFYLFTAPELLPL